ncbi:MAG: ComEC/Rec2 family competence protein [Phycisphaerae bacterium]
MERSAFRATIMRALVRACTVIERTAPLLPVAVGMVVGIILDRALALPPGACVAGFGLCLAACVLKRLRGAVGPAILLPAAVCVGAALHAQRSVSSATSIARHMDGERRLARVRGRVVGVPRVLAGDDYTFYRWLHRADRTAMIVDVMSIEADDGWVEATGRIRVTVGEAVLDVRPQEPVELFGWLVGLTPPKNPGAFDWSTFYRRQGIVARMYCDRMENVRRLEGAEDYDGRGRTQDVGVVRGTGLGGAAAERAGAHGVGSRRAGEPDRDTWLARFRASARAMLTDDLATGAREGTSLLEAMILGHRSRLDRRVNEVFIRAGCIHFLAVSGVHIVFVIGFVRALCHVVRVSGHWTTCAMMGAVVVYVIIAEPRPPILRAGIIAMVYLVSRLLGRERAYLNWISVTVIVLAVVDPAMVFDVGYQLSSAAVLGVSYVNPALCGAAVYASRRVRWLWYRRGTRLSADERDAVMAALDGIAARCRPRRTWAGVTRRLLHALAISLGAWLAAVPIVAWHFHRIQPWGPIGSVVVVLLVGVVMWLGFAKILAGVMLPTVAALLGAPLAAATWCLIHIVNAVAALPGASITVAAPPLWLVAVYYAFLGVLVWAFPRRDGATRRRRPRTDRATQPLEATRPLDATRPVDATQAVDATQLVKATQLVDAPQPVKATQPAEATQADRAGVPIDDIPALDGEPPVHATRPGAATLRRHTTRAVGATSALGAMWWAELRPADERYAPRTPRAARWGVCVTCVGVAACVAWWLWSSRSTGALVVHVLSVGSGSATVIELPDGHTVLYDAGSSSPYDVGRGTIVPFLRSRGISRVDRIYVSHPNLDHFGGVPGVIDEVPAGPVVINEHFDRFAPAGTPARHLLTLLADRRHPVRVEDASVRAWTAGGVWFERLWPAPVGSGDGVYTAVASANDSSTVLRLTYAGHSIVLTGDIEDPAQRALRAMAGLAADVLVLPHHGGVRAGTGSFLDAVGARYLIRSSHEPMARTRSALAFLAGDTPLLNTADVGAVRVVIDPAGVSVSGFVHETGPNKFRQPAERP